MTSGIVVTGETASDGWMARVRAFVRCVLQLALSGLLAFSAAAFAESQTYKGLMIPSERDIPVPIGITVDRADGKLKGRFTSFPPFVAEGVFVANVRNIHQCEFTTNIGGGRTLVFDGYCFTNTIEGKYTLRFPDGSMRDGHFQLKREAAKRTPEKASAEFSSQPLVTVTSCLNANSACLAACPHGDYNAEFVCSNRCRQKHLACKAKANSPAVSAP